MEKGSPSGLPFFFRAGLAKRIAAMWVTNGGDGFIPIREFLDQRSILEPSWFQKF